MNANPLFSVLIANYNNGKYLMEAINSVYVQTYTNWEIILVDDASTDNSKEIYKELEKDTRIHIFYNDENHGCGYTKRRCAELANGELCGFLDADDIIAKDALHIMVIEHFKHESISMAYSDMYYCDENLNIISTTHRAQIPDNTTFLELYNYVSQFAVYKRSVYLKTEGISADAQRAVDHDLYFKLEEYGPFAFVSQPLYFYRTGTGKNISCDENQIKALFWDYVAMIDACRRRNIPIESIVMPRFLNLISYYKRQLNSVYNSNTYRVGNFIVLPYRIMRKLFNKISNLWKRK